jgi:hypothetical protein
MPGVSVENLFLKGGKKKDPQLLEYPIRGEKWKR